jgi:glutathionyl-hydroquinone reductase
VNNESSELIRIFNQDLNDLIPAEKAAIDIYPRDLRPQIDELNAWIYHGISSMSKPFLSAFYSMANSHCIIDGVYRSGGATTQAAYEKAVVEVFDALDKVEKILTGKDYLVGDKLTEADVRLWVTIVCLNYT